MLAWLGVAPQIAGTISPGDGEVTVDFWLQKLEHPLLQWCRHSQLEMSNISFAYQVKSCNPLS